MTSLSKYVIGVLLIRLVGSILFHRAYTFAYNDTAGDIITRFRWRSYPSKPVTMQQLITRPTWPMTCADYQSLVSHRIMQ